MLSPSIFDAINNAIMVVFDDETMANANQEG